jgi:proteasome accessory factor A
MMRDGLIERVSTEWEIERAMTTPPQTTRAKVRSDFINFAKGKNKSYDVGWSYLRFNGRDSQTIILRDPFSSWDPRVEQLFLPS